MTSSDRRRTPGRTARGGRPPREKFERPDHRRTALAVEAARVMHEQGITDFRAAKAKAVERLGFGKGVPLPDNKEIEAALAERARIFHGDFHPALMAELRQEAILVMRDLENFHPRLVGDVRSGNATIHSAVELHVFSDTAEAVNEQLSALGIVARTVQRRYRMREGEFASFSGYRFTRDGVEFSCTVFPMKSRGTAPLSPIDGRPMKRANLREVEGMATGATDPA